MDALIELVNEQAEDEGLWFLAETAPEAYLQQELRRLHELIEQIAAGSAGPTSTERGSFGDRSAVGQVGQGPVHQFGRIGPAVRVLGGGRRSGAAVLG